MSVSIVQQLLHKCCVVLNCAQGRRGGIEFFFSTSAMCVWHKQLCIKMWERKPARGNTNVYHELRYSDMSFYLRDQKSLQSCLNSRQKSEEKGSYSPLPPCMHCVSGCELRLFGQNFPSSVILSSKH